MKYSIFLLVMIFFSQFGCSQDLSLNQKVERLEEVKNVPYLPELSGDSIFWIVVKEKIEVIPFLIQKLNDTTSTEANIQNFGGNYTVADIAYLAISEIIRDIPTMDFVVKSDNPAGGYWYYWDYVRANYDNRILFQSKVKEWFDKNKSNLKWVEDTSSYRTAPDWKFKSDKHPAGGHYIIEQK